MTAPEQTPDMTALNPGSEQFPESGATLIIKAARISTTSGGALTGPGVRETRKLDVAGAPGRFWRQRREMTTVFPLEVDVIFTAGREFCALPRTTRVES